jgi:hypothetical protein
MGLSILKDCLILVTYTLLLRQDKTCCVSIVFGNAMTALQ